jgi:hypothetical protein
MKVSRGFVIVTTAILFLSLPIIAMASDQAPVGPRNELSVELAMPIAINLAVVNDGYAVPIVLDYQRVLSDHFVLSVVPGLLFVHRGTLGDILLAQLWVELDWHPFQEGLRGFFIGPAVVGLYASNVYGSFGSAGTAMAGAALGYQILLPANLDLDISLVSPLVRCQVAAIWARSLAPRSLWGIDSS